MSGMILVLTALAGGGAAIAVLAWLLAARGKGAAGVLSAPAQVIGIRQTAAGREDQHWVGFRFADGHQRELMATASQACVLTVGQTGTVHWAGDRLTGWIPEVEASPKDRFRSELE